MARVSPMSRAFFSNKIELMSSDKKPEASSTLAVSDAAGAVGRGSFGGGARPASAPM
ncbi:MAG: hypothetical protein OXU61_10010 [Gammaproteobacteria bacterium]|nr:hypothetical protein [Gammaproteobacteria bacterium]